MKRYKGVQWVQTRFVCLRNHNETHWTKAWNHISMRFYLRRIVFGDSKKMKWKHGQLISCTRKGLDITKVLKRHIFILNCFNTDNKLVLSLTKVSSELRKKQLPGNERNTYGKKRLSSTSVRVKGSSYENDIKTQPIKVLHIMVFLMRTLFRVEVVN